MNKILLLGICLVLAGCNYGGEGFQTYLENPKALLEDPHYKHHQQKLNNLERQYLNEDISYVDYVAQKKTLQENYQREVERRRSIIESNY